MEGKKLFSEEVGGGYYFKIYTQGIMDIFPLPLPGDGRLYLNLPTVVNILVGLVVPLALYKPTHRSVYTGRSSGSTRFIYTYLL